jgi:hypothetical protein
VVGWLAHQLGRELVDGGELGFRRGGHGFGHCAPLDVLRRAGFDPQHASAIARSLLWTGITLVMSEPGYKPELDPEERGEMQRRNQVALAMLPASKYPRLIECAVPMTTCDEPEFHYRFGIGLFIDGVKAAARPISGEATADTRSG